MPLIFETKVFSKGPSQFADDLRVYGIRRAAEDIGVHYSAISLWLDGQRGMKYDVFKKLARRVGYGADGKRKPKA